MIQQETTDYDEYTGKTEASEAVDIHARVFGYLKSIEFKDGDFVKEGQTLFTIEPDEYEAIHNQSLSKIAVWEAKLKVAKANLARRQSLMATPGAISREELEEYAAAVNRGRGESECGQSRRESNGSRFEVHRSDSAHQRSHRSRDGLERDASDRWHRLRDVAHENCR